LEEIARFERELSCQRLRAQLARLRESLPASASTEDRKDSAAGPVPVQTAVQEKPTPSPVLPQPVTVDQAKACKQDEGRLSQLRAKPQLSEIVEFERALECEKLRPQIVRLRESLSPADAAGTRGVDDSEGRSRPRLGNLVKSCDQEKGALARLRENPSRGQVVEFERQLSCEALRAQVLRLLESLPGN
jgi:hypothetical protein